MKHDTTQGCDDISICIDTDLADTLSIRLGAVSRYFQIFTSKKFGNF